MAFYRIEVPAYFNTRLNAERPANTFHVNGKEACQRHIAQIINQAAASAELIANMKVTQLTAAEYRAVALAKLRG